MVPMLVQGNWNFIAIIDSQKQKYIQNMLFTVRPESNPHWHTILFANVLTAAQYPGGKTCGRWMKRTS